MVIRFIFYLSAPMNICMDMIPHYKCLLYCIVLLCTKPLSIISYIECNDIVGPHSLIWDYSADLGPNWPLIKRRDKDQYTACQS